MYAHYSYWFMLLKSSELHLNKTKMYKILVCYILYLFIKLQLFIEAFLDIATFSLRMYVYLMCYTGDVYSTKIGRHVILQMMWVRTGP